MSQCLKCGPVNSQCNQCVGVVSSDLFSYRNPGFPTYKNALGKCVEVRRF